MRKRTILCDSNNHRENHPEIEIFESLGHETQTVPLIGDYCLKSEAVFALEDNLRHEEFTQRTYHNKPEYKSKALTKLDLAGTYSVSVDTKKGVAELYQCLVQGTANKRYRFERELMKAKDLGIELWILIIDDVYQDMEAVKNYVTFSGYHCGERLIDTMKEMENKHGCHFIFSDQQHAAELILKILLAGEHGGSEPKELEPIGGVSDFGACYKELEDRLGPARMSRFYEYELVTATEECKKMKLSDLSFYYTDMVKEITSIPERKYMIATVARVLALYHLQEYYNAYFVRRDEGL